MRRHQVLRQIAAQLCQNPRQRGCPRPMHPQDKNRGALRGLSNGTLHLGHLHGVPLFPVSHICIGPIRGSSTDGDSAATCKVMQLWAQPHNAFSMLSNSFKT